jgi:hypothetical protein
MDKAHFIQHMGYPKEWLGGYLLDAYLEDQITGWLSEHEADRSLTGEAPGSEHYRYGAFLYWLKRDPSLPQLEKLLALSYLDKDQVMATDAHRRIARAKLASPEMRFLADEKYK